MKDYILMMHDDALDPAVANNGQLWGSYLAKLRASGHFEGGSAIGNGIKIRRGQSAQASQLGLSGFIRVRADDIAQAQTLLLGNPVYDAGGSVEILELPSDG
jgi:hypothetical protein